MQPNRTLWPTWAQFLQRWGIDDLASTLLDASGPLAVIGAQFLYLGQPFFNQGSPAGHLQALAELLEDPAEIKTFAAYLREEKPL